LLPRRTEGGGVEHLLQDLVDHALLGDVAVERVADLLFIHEFIARLAFLVRPKVMIVAGDAGGLLRQDSAPTLSSVCATIQPVPRSHLRNNGLSV
jgi:hypothetical protein